MLDLILSVDAYNQRDLVLAFAQRAQSKGIIIINILQKEYEKEEGRNTCIMSQ